ncbi:glycosyltransferase family 2 protein [Deinococcus sp.]|uniref:glycosyltransferase family 2 protein n=1 Tax=Deinococcus sp. TaxID=47478 RepID=UPI002869C1DE|nr:glycosyltransferase family 2 protein [Deinococcus sp.]
MTVILCVFNGERHLDQAIQSVRDQTYPHWRLLIVDDGSTDQSSEMLQRHATGEPRIQLIRQANSGVQGARNHALEVATTRWVALLDHDDVYLPTKLERQMTFLAAHSHVAALGTHGYRIGQTGARLGYFDVGPRDEEHCQRLVEQHAVIYLLAASVVFDRELALSVGGFPHLSAADDVGLWSRMADHAPVLALAERLVNYRVHAGSISGQKLNLHRLELESIRRGNRRRHSGQPELDFDGFMTEWNAQPVAVRRAFERESASLNAYRIAGGLLADRKPAGLVWLARSIALNPAGRLRRVATQLDLQGRWRRRWRARPPTR